MLCCAVHGSMLKAGKANTNTCAVQCRMLVAAGGHICLTGALDGATSRRMRMDACPAGPLYRMLTWRALHACQGADGGRA